MDAKMLDDGVILTRDYLERAIPEIEILAGELYQSIAKETWEKLVQFIEGLQWLTKMAGYFEDQPMNVYYNSFHQFYITIQNHLDEFEKALVDSDQVVLADLLTYEFLPALGTLNHNLKQDENGGAADDLN